MRKERHKRKEIFSVLMISNTGRSNRRYRISKFALHLIAVLLILVCVVAGGLSFWAIRIIGGQMNRQEQMAEQDRLMAQLKEENERLSGELASFNENLGVARETEETTEETEEAIPQEQEPDIQEEGDHPNRFPSSGVASVIASYSQESPYMSFGMQVEDSIIATQDGTVVGISSDDAYPYIIEMEHEGGYRTRYMCNQEADLNVQEGEQVDAGDALLTITVENTQLDYQVYYNGEPIDPINIIDAKG